MQQGGHNVSEYKIETRYFYTLGLLKDAFLLSDSAFIIDTTIDRGEIILEKKNSQVSILVDEIPEWVDQYLLKFLT